MGKGVIVVLAAVVIFLMITAAVRHAVLSYQEDRQVRAIANAKWTMYVEPKGNQTIEVGIHQVARWGNYAKILKTERLTDVKVNVNDPTDLTLAEAKEAAKNLAFAYNAKAE
jgi:hypothetical protein